MKINYLQKNQYNNNKNNKRAFMICNINNI